MQGPALEVTSYKILNYGLHDVGKVTEQSSLGWYGGAIPSLFVGMSIRWLALGSLYAMNRNMQAKKKMKLVLRQETKGRIWFGAYLIILLGLFAGALYFILLDNS